MNPIAALVIALVLCVWASSGGPPGDTGGVPVSRLEGMEPCGWPPLLDSPEPEGPDEWHPDESGLDQVLDLDYTEHEHRPWWAGEEETPW